MPRKNRNYSTEDMEMALRKIKEEGISLGQAQKEFNIPKQTLSDRLNSKYKGTKIGRPTELTEEEEKALIYYIQYMASIAAPLTVNQIKIFAWAIAKKHRGTRFNKDEGPGDTWWNGFRKRHREDITIRVADTLDRGRSRMANQNVMNQHFKLLKDTLEKNNLMDKPDRIFNCDESGISLDKQTAKVVVHRKAKQAYKESKGSREHITAHTCVSASGIPLPPFLIFEKCYPSGPYGKNGPDGALYGISPNGYMDIELFYLWVDKLFIPKTAHLQKPILLICDGHGSHLDITTIDLLVNNQIVLYCLPPHTTNILQPLDVSIFRPLKTSFSHITDLIKLASMTTKSTISVCKRNFTPLFKVAFEKALSISNIKNGFRKCGVYPFEPTAIDTKRLMPSDDILIATAGSSNNTVTNFSTTTATTSSTNSPSNATTTSSSTATTTSPNTATTTSPSIATTTSSSTATTTSPNTATITSPPTLTVTSSSTFSTVSTTNSSTITVNADINLDLDDVLPNIDLTIDSNIDFVLDSPRSEIFEFETSLTDVIECTLVEPAPPSNPHTPKASLHPSLPGASSTPSGSPFVCERLKKVSPLISSGKIPASLLSSFIIPDTSPEKREKNTRVVTEARVMTSEVQIKLLKEKLEAKKKEEEEKKRKKEEREKKKLEKEKKEKEKQARKEQKAKDKEAKKKRKSDELLKVRIQPPTKRGRKAKRKVVFFSDDDDTDEDYVEPEVDPSNQTGNEPEVDPSNPTGDEATCSSRKSARQRKAPTRFVDIESSSDDSDIAYDNSHENCGVCKRKKAPMKMEGRKRDPWIYCDTCGQWFHNVCIGATDEDSKKETFFCKYC